MVNFNLIIKINRFPHKVFIAAIDSWGKLPSGILSGNLFEIGSYDQCVKIAETSFTGQYCLSTFNIDISAVPLSGSLIKTRQSAKNLPLAKTQFMDNDESINIP